MSSGKNQEGRCLSQSHAEELTWTYKHELINYNPTQLINHISLSPGRRQSADWISVGELWSDGGSDQRRLP